MYYSSAYEETSSGLLWTEY